MPSVVRRVWLSFYALGILISCAHGLCPPTGARQHASARVSYQTSGFNLIEVLILRKLPARFQGRLRLRRFVSTVPCNDEASENLT